MTNDEPSEPTIPVNASSFEDVHAGDRRRIGPYKLLQKIAEGGMGEVWMAEQDRPVRRRVALKLIKTGMDNQQIIARFEAERQALAMMDHQNIAKVLDAGTTEDGLPYFVMELVQGIPFTKYCDQNKLSIDERLKLFMPVCQAVQHAHQKGIIHRDLKPSNVLVCLYDGQPVPKVIDFGLAKAIQHQTRLTDKTMFTEFGQVVGTVQYMSPEQAEMNQLDIDTRTDIYSLGVMLYEMLTGSTPLEANTLKQLAVLEILETIRSKDPPRPSVRLSNVSQEAASGISEQRRIEVGKLKSLLSGELDWIVMKALEKDRSRRYSNASEFGTDINRFLSGEVVVARPPTVAYRLRKYVRKNKGLVASFAAVGWVLLAGIIGTTWFAIQAESAKQDATLKAAALQIEKTKLQAEKERADVEAETARLEAEKARAQEQAANELRTRSQESERLANLAAKEAQVSRETANHERARAEESARRSLQAEKDAELAKSAAIVRSNELKKANDNLSRLTARYKILIAQEKLQQLNIAEAKELLNSVPPRYREIEWGLLMRKAGSYVIEYHEHTSPVTAICFNSNNTHLASADSSGRILIRNLTNKQSPIEIQCNATPPKVLSIDEKSQYLYCSNLAFIEKWDVVTGKLLSIDKILDYVSLSRPFENQDLPYVFSHEHRCLIVQDIQQTPNQSIRLVHCDFNLGKRQSVEIPRGELVSVTNTEVFVMHTNVRVAKERHPPENNGSEINCCSYSVGDGTKTKLIDFPSSSSYSRLYHLPNDRIFAIDLSNMRSLNPKGAWGHFAVDTINGLSPDSILCAGIQGQHNLRLLEIKTGKVIANIRFKSRLSDAVVFSSDGSQVAVGTQDGELAVIHREGRAIFVDTGVSLEGASQNHKLASRQSTNPNSNLLVVDTNCIRELNTSTFAIGRKFVPPDNLSILQSRLSSDGSVCAMVFLHDLNSKRPDSPGSEPALAIVDLETMQLRRTVIPPFGPNHFGFTPSGSHLMLFDGEGKLVIWDIMSNIAVREHSIAAGGLHIAEFFDGGREAILGYCNYGTPETNNCLLSVWDIVRGKLKKVLSGDLRNHIQSVAVNHSRSIAAISLSHSILVFDTKTHELISSMNSGQEEAGELMFTSDDSRLLSISENRLLKVWELATGELVLSLPMEEALHQLTLIPADNELFAVNEIGKLVRFTLPISKHAAYLCNSTRNWREISFSPDGTKVIAVSDDNDLYGWDVESMQPLSGELEMPSSISDTACNESVWVSSDERGISLQRVLLDLKSEQHGSIESSMPRLSRWYRDQAEENERESHWYAAMHYWAWSFINDRDDKEILDRFHKVYQQWQAERTLPYQELDATSQSDPIWTVTLRPNLDERNLLSPVLLEAISAATLDRKTTR